MGNRIRHFDACRVQCFNLVISRSLAAADDGARMTHAFAGRRLTAADEPDNRFLHVGFDPLRRLFFRRTANLADHNDSQRVVVCIKGFQGFNIIHALNRIAAQTYRGGLADTCHSQLVGRFIGQGAGTADYAHMPFPVNICRQ